MMLKRGCINGARRCLVGYRIFGINLYDTRIRTGRARARVILIPAGLLLPLPLRVCT